MANLKELARAAAAIKPNHSILIYSRPKLGKTRLAGTAAKIPELRKIFFFDLENGAETLAHMDLTDEEMEKVTVFKLSDTRETPVGIETMLKAMSAKNIVNICDGHGKCDCVECKKAGIPSTRFALSECTHNDLVIIDSGSQLADSALAACMLGKDTMAKPGWDEYGVQGKWLGDILSVIQQCRHTNFVVLTHEIVVEEELNDVKKDAVYPLMGTKAFSMKVAKYFGTVVYLYKKGGKHAGASSSVFRPDVLTGSRLNVQIEKAKELDMRSILIEGGIIREENPSAESPNPAPEAATLSSVSTLPTKLTLAERLALKKQ